MAKNISLLGADYPDVPAVQLPQTGGGTATFYDINVVDDLNSDSSTDALSAKQGKVLNTKIVNLVTHEQYLSSESDWDAAIENYVDTLPNDSKCHIGFVQRSGAGVVMCIIQKYASAGYASAIAFGYWRTPYFYWKDNGSWTAKKLSLV